MLFYLRDEMAPLIAFLFMLKRVKPLLDNLMSF